MGWNKVFSCVHIWFTGQVAQSGVVISGQRVRLVKKK